MRPFQPDLFPVSFPGVKTSRDDLVVDIDRDRLEKRMGQYFDPLISHEEMRRLCPCALESTARFSAEDVRNRLIKRGFQSKHILRYCYRPFDLRWIYWEPDTELLDRKREDFRAHLSHYGNVFLEARQRQPKEDFDRGYCTRHLADNFGNGLSSFFPLFILEDTEDDLFVVREATIGNLNLSDAATAYIAHVRASRLDLFYHALSILHSPAYRRENSGALRQDWPRIPLPNATKALGASATLGRRVAELLDPETDIAEITASDIRPDLSELGVFSLVPGHILDEETDLALTAGWGHAGKGGVTMPGRGKLTQRPYTPAERDALAAGAKALGLSLKQTLALLGEQTCDVWLNDNAFWRNVPAGVWDYTLGGYPVIKKWLSYREHDLLGRPFRTEEVRHVTAMIRRIAALLLLSPALDTHYQTAKANPHPPPGKHETQ